MVTVLMPVRNGEKYVRESVESVLKQTFADFEFIIIDDGSTDNTVSVIKSYNDSRIRIVEQEHDFVGALNRGLQMAKGEYIARMDADDVMHTERLRIQVKRMTLNPEITVLSSWASAFGDDGSIMPPMKTGEGYVEEPVLEMLRGNFVIHPSVMLRTSFIRNHNLEYPDYPQAEDYKLWFEIAKLGGKFYIEPQLLMNFRVSSTQITSVKRETMFEQTVRIKKEILDYLVRKEQSDELESLQTVTGNLGKEKLLPEGEIFKLFYTVLKNIIHNRKKKIQLT
jgi:glycosyltransferase involved in cell wall biosynthesis